MKQKHTPGPWYISRKENSSPHIAPEANKGLPICYMAACYSEDSANARLIAAAPELLEACKSIIDSWETNENHPLQHLPDECDLCAMIYQVKKAIAKAEGTA